MGINFMTNMVYSPCDSLLPSYLQLNKEFKFVVFTSHHTLHIFWTCYFVFCL